MTYTRIRYFKIPNFFCAEIGFRPHVSGVSGVRVRNFLNPLSSWTCVSYNVCAVKPTLLSFFPCRTVKLGAVNEHNSAWSGGTILSVKQLLKNVGDKIFSWAEGRFTN